MTVHVNAGGHRIAGDHRIAAGQVTQVESWPERVRAGLSWL